MFDFRIACMWFSWSDFFYLHKLLSVLLEIKLKQFYTIKSYI